MTTRTSTLASAVVALASCGSDGAKQKGVFPEGFLFGAATAAWQVESADPPATDWGQWELMPGKVAHGDRAAGGPDAWNRHDEDFALAAQMGHNAVRISLEWARIEPTQGTFDEAAIAHYQAMIASMKAHGLRPVVTLWHFVNPTWVQDLAGGPSLGGWETQATVDAYISFVTRVVPRFSADVDFWVTLNEPMIYIIQGYFMGVWPPGKAFGLSSAVTVHNKLIAAHVGAYDAIHAHYLTLAKPVTVTIASHFVALDPAKPEDEAATRGVERIIDFAFLDAIVKGDVDTTLDGTAVVHRDDYAGKADVIGVNFYQRQIVSTTPIGFVPGIPSIDPAASPKSDLGWQLYPVGMGRALDGLWNRYHVPLVITENGIADAADRARAWYIVAHVDEVQQALARGVDVRGYLHWSLIDNFEWAEGFGARFGLIGIDYATKARTPRASAAALSDIIKANEVTAAIRARYPAP